MNSPNKQKTIWLLQLSETLPIDLGARPMRTGIIASTLQRLGHKVVWFAGRFDHISKTKRTSVPQISQLSELHTLVLLDGVSYTRNISFRRVVNQIQTALAFLLISRRLPRPTLAIISYPSPELSAVGALYCKCHRIPYVIDVRDAWPSIFYKGYFSPAKLLLVLPLATCYEYLLRISLRWSKASYASTSTLLEDIKKRLSPEKTTRIFYSSHPKQIIKPSRSVERSFTLQPLVVVFLGSFGRSYDIEFLVRIAKLLNNVNEVRIKFKIIGDGEMRTTWEAQAADLFNVYFTGWLQRDQVLQELRAADVGACLIKGGTADFAVPNKFAEYLSFGLAVLSNVNGELPDIIGESNIGLSCTSKQEEMVVNWLLSIVENPALLATYQNNALNLFEEKFNADTVYLRMCNAIVHDCLGASS